MITERVIVEPNGRRFSADSMDRFGDDLCELCVSYLEFAEKTAFECLSRQWMTTIHRRQTQLFIDSIRDEANADKPKFYNWVYDCNSYSVPFILRHRSDDSTRLESLLKKYPNIESIELRDVCIDRRVVEVLAKYCRRLTCLWIRGSDLIDDTIDINRKQLKTLKISTANWDSNYGITSRQMINTLAKISRLTDIEELDLSFFSITDRVGEKSVDIDQQLHEIGINCKKIRRFCLSLDYYFKLEGNVFKSLAAFQSLKHFEIDFEITNTKQSIADIGLKKNMTTLIIHSHKIGDQFFKDIHTFAPNLKTFSLTTRLSDISDNLLTSVSKLKHLEVLSLRRLRSALKNITDSGVQRLLDNCERVKRIDFSYRTSITNKSIEKLISLAKTRPKQVIEFKTTNIDPNKEILIPVIDVSQIVDNIPGNLVIEIQ